MSLVIDLVDLMVYILYYSKSHHIHVEMNIIKQAVMRTQKEVTSSGCGSDSLYLCGMLRKHDIHFLARLYESTGRAIAVTPASASALALASALLKMLKFLVKVSLEVVDGSS